VEPEFGGEIGDGRLGQTGVLGREPAPLVGPVVVEQPEYRRVVAEKRRVFREPLEPFGLYVGQKLDRVMVREKPESRVDRLEELSCLQRPAPPQVVSQFPETVEALRQMGG